MRCLGAALLGIHFDSWFVFFGVLLIAYSLKGTGE
jgi:hypothetical protein